MVDRKEFPKYLFINFTTAPAIITLIVIGNLITSLILWILDNFGFNVSSIVIGCMMMTYYSKMSKTTNVSKSSKASEVSEVGNKNVSKRRRRICTLSRNSAMAVMDEFDDSNIATNDTNAMANDTNAMTDDTNAAKLEPHKISDMFHDD